MTNMSYCRFENTYRALQDCVHALDDMGINNQIDLSDTERDYALLMVGVIDKYKKFLDELKNDGILKEV